MENKIAKQNQIGQLSEADLKQLELANIIPKGTPAPQVQIFATVCKEKGLSPFQKQIYLLPFKKKIKDKWETHYACITGIDGYRTIAERTGCYAGCEDVKFNNSQTEHQCREAGLNNPITATVTVYKIVAKQRVPFTATAGWSSYLPAENKRFNWIKMPFLMLGKVAEALALRKAFPEALSGLHVEEEGGGFVDTESVEVELTEELKKEIIKELKPIKNKSELIKLNKKYPQFQEIEEYQKLFKDKLEEIEENQAFDKAQKEEFIKQTIEDVKSPDELKIVLKDNGDIMNNETLKKLYNKKLNSFKDGK